MLGFVSGYLGGRRALAKAARVAADGAGGISSSLAPDPVADLQQQMDRMAVIVEGLWELLRSHGHTDEELKGIVEQITSRSNASALCPDCGSRVQGSARCQICGTDVGGETSALPGAG